MKHITNLLSVILLGLSACTSAPDIKGFNFEAWRTDRNACQGTRDTMQANLERIRPQLKGISDRHLMQLLGKPDRNELDERNRKYITYFISAGSQCDPKSSTLGKRIKFSSSAMGIISEAIIE